MKECNGTGLLNMFVCECVCIRSEWRIVMFTTKEGKKALVKYCMGDWWKGAFKSCQDLNIGGGLGVCSSAHLHSTCEFMKTFSGIDFQANPDHTSWAFTCYWWANQKVWSKGANISEKKIRFDYSTDSRVSLWKHNLIWSMIITDSFKQKSTFSSCSPIRLDDLHSVSVDRGCNQTLRVFNRCAGDTCIKYSPQNPRAVRPSKASPLHLFI